MSDNTEALPIVAHEWDTPLPNGTWQGHLTYEYPAGGAGYQYRHALVRLSDAQAAIRAALAQQAATPTLTDEQIDALDTFSLHWMAPRQRESVREFARAVLAAARQAATPAPAEPTKAMMEAGMQAFIAAGGESVTNAQVALMFRAMIAAPPATPAAQPAEVCFTGLDDTAEQQRMRLAAEKAYIKTAFDYARAPVGSRDWTLFWQGYQQARAALAARGAA